MTLSFEDATRERTKARIALAGPAGSGKTRWALELAMLLGEKVAVIDTENKSASLYVGVNGIRFKACNLSTFEIQNYIDAIKLAERSGFDVIVVDSLSHAWMGEGGALDQVDKVKAKSGNAFTEGWGAVTPLQNKLINAITQCRAHIIVTLRSHQEYVLEERTNRSGKTIQVPVRKGMAAVQRKGMEYEFSIYGELSVDDHGLEVTKSRLDPIKNGKVSTNELAHFAQTVREFHESGAEPSAAPPPAAAQTWKPWHERVWKLYRNSSVVDHPVSSIPMDKLIGYIARLEKDLKSGSERIQRDGQPFHAAAVAELAKRRAAEVEMADDGGDEDTDTRFSSPVEHQGDAPS